MTCTHDRSSSGVQRVVILCGEDGHQSLVQTAMGVSQAVLGREVDVEQVDTTMVNQRLASTTGKGGGLKLQSTVAIQWPLFMGLIYAKRGSIGGLKLTVLRHCMYCHCCVSNPLITVWYSAINSDSHHV